VRILLYSIQGRNEEAVAVQAHLEGRDQEDMLPYLIGTGCEMRPQLQGRRSRHPGGTTNNKQKQPKNCGWQMDKRLAMLHDAVTISSIFNFFMSSVLGNVKPLLNSPLAP